jgi:hypothetical protein
MFKSSCCCWHQEREKGEREVKAFVVSSNRALVDHLLYHPKVQGSSPAAVADTGREKKSGVTAIIVNSTVVEPLPHHSKVIAGNTKGGSITVPLTSCLTGLELAV